MQSKTPEHAPLQFERVVTALAGGVFSASPSTNSACLAILVGSSTQVLVSPPEDGLFMPSAASKVSQV